MVTETMRLFHAITWQHNVYALTKWIWIRNNCFFKLKLYDKTISIPNSTGKHSKGCRLNQRQNFLDLGRSKDEIWFFSSFQMRRKYKSYFNAKTLQTHVWPQCVPHSQWHAEESSRKRNKTSSRQYYRDKRTWTGESLLNVVMTVSNLRVSSHILVCLLQNTNACSLQLAWIMAVLSWNGRSLGRWSLIPGTF